MTLDATTVELYDDYLVSAISLAVDNPTPIPVTIGVQIGVPPVGWDSRPDILHNSIQLTEPGTYTFLVKVFATAGSDAGTAEVKVTYTLEDDPHVAP